LERSAFFIDGRGEGVMESLYKRQQEKYYKVGFYGGVTVMAPLILLGAFNRSLPTPWLKALVAIVGVYGLLFLGYSSFLLFRLLRQGVRETRARRAGVPDIETGGARGSGGTTAALVSADPGETPRFWSYRRVLVLCGVVGIIGSLIRIAGWWTS